MTDELRIRETRAGRNAQAERDAGRAPPGGAGEGRPGETAWDLAEPLFGAHPPAAPKGDAAPQEASFAPPPFPPFPGFGGEEEEAPQPSAIDLRRLLHGLRKRLWLAALIAAAIVGLSLAAAILLVKHNWEAAATIMVRTRPDQFSLGSAKPFESQDYNLKTMLDTVKLPSALAQLSESLKLEASERTLGAAIGVKVGKESNLFQITAVWKDPANAAAIANQAARQLIQRSRDLRRMDAEKAYADYAGQLEEARRELTALTERMRAFKGTHQVSDFGAETQVLLDSLSRLETELNTKKAETEAMRETLADIEESIKKEPEMVVTSSVYRNPLKTRLTDYEWQLQEARSRYTEENPKVIKLQTRVNVLKQMIDETKDEGAPENLYSANAKLVDLQQRRRGLNEEIRLREAQIAALSQTIQGSRAKLTGLTEAEREYQLLQQQLKSAENLVSTLVGRVDEAKVVVQRNQAAFDLMETARPPTEPLPSPKKLIAIGGVFLGGLFGLFAALLLELLDPRIRTRRDALAIPGIVLAWELQQAPEAEGAALDAETPGTPVALLFRRLINDLDAKLEPEEWRCLGIASAEAGAGRSLVAAHLARALAMKEYPVILVDGDLRPGAGERPLARAALRPDPAGLVQVLNGEAPVAAAIGISTLPGLSLIPAGVAAPEPEPMVQSPDRDLACLGSQQFRSILETLRDAGRRLVFDLPPLDAHETVSEAATALGNLLLAARAGQTTRAGLREAVALLEERGAKVRGILVTGIPEADLEGAPLFAVRRSFGLAHKARAGVPPGR